MIDNKVHRLPVIDNDGSIVLSLTYRSICRFLVSKFRFNSAVLDKPIMESGVPQAQFNRIYCDQTVLEAIILLVRNNLSMIPIMERADSPENEKLYNVFSKYDFSSTASGGDINLKMTVKEVADKRPEFIEGCVTMPCSCTIGGLLRLIADRNLHRMMLVDEEDPKKLVAVVSLRHVLRYLTQPEVYES